MTEKSGIHILFQIIKAYRPPQIAKKFQKLAFGEWELD